jgi:hypothetical protein
MTKIYWSNGKIHRSDGPAVIHEDGTQEWWKKGIRHRLDGPAIFNAQKRIAINIIKGTINPVHLYMTYYGTSVETYTEPSVIIEAVSRIKDITENIPSHKETSSDKIEEFERGMLIKKLSINCSIFYLYGVKHNEDSPAFISQENTKWFHYGMLHNTNGPSQIQITKNYTNYMWYYFGRLQSMNNKPAYVKVDNYTRKTIDQFYYDKGKLHNDKGPALIMMDDSLMKKIEIHYSNGKLHNLNGPAYIENKSEIPVYCIYGKNYEEKQYKKITKIISKFVYKLRLSFRVKLRDKIYKETNYSKDTITNICDYLL